jgi:hypothetical protein
MRAAAATTVLVGTCLLAGHALADTIPVPPLPPAPPVPTVGVPTPPVTVPTPPVAAPLPAVPKLPPPAAPAPGPVQAPPASPAAPVVPAVSAVPAAPSVPSSVTGSTPAVGSAGSTQGAGSAGSTLGLRSAGSTQGVGSAGSTQGVGSAGSTLGAGSAGSPSSAPAAGPGSDPTRVERFHSSRRWIATSGPKRRRVTVLTFVLPRAARVVFVVKQVSPICRVAGHFAVKGHAGRNRVRFPGRTSKLRLDPGTYRITARTRAGRVVQRVTIIVVDSGTPTRNQIIAARASNVCTAAGRLAAAAGGSTGASNTSNAAQEVQRSFTPAGKPSASGPIGGGNSHSGAVLGSSVEKASRAVRPVLIALLALAIALLAIASLPRLAVPESRANELLARHRTEIAVLGAAAFVAVVITFLLG